MSIADILEAPTVTVKAEVPKLSFQQVAMGYEGDIKRLITEAAQEALESVDWDKVAKDQMEAAKKAVLAEIEAEKANQLARVVDTIKARIQAATERGIQAAIDEHVAKAEDEAYDRAMKAINESAD